jgi:hypothetical protein
MMLTYEEIQKLNAAEIGKKVAELKKDYFEKSHFYLATFFLVFSSSFECGAYIF